MMQGWKTYDCSDLEQHRSFLEELQVYLHPSDLTAQQDFRTTFSARYMSHGYIARAGYGPAVRISKTADEWSWNHVISMPVSGSIRSDLDGASRISDRDHFVLRPPASIHSFETTADTDELFLAINPDYLKTFCANLLGRPVQGPIRFAPDLSPNSPHGRALRTAANLGLGNTEFPPNGVSRSRFDAQLQEFVATTLLMHHPHNLRDELCGRSPLPASRDVKRALDYIHSRLTETIGLEDLIAISNVPGRTLNEHFRLFLGISPMAYVKRERLKLAREKLSTEPNLTVTEVATSCGFSHLGRFSIEYASAFGEKPSMTREAAQRDF